MRDLRFRPARRILLAALPVLVALDAAAASRPNIVLILADDLGFSDTAPYGSEIPTPAISRLAEAGIRFSNYHTAASCAPARAMLLTGVDSHRNGVPNIPEAIPPEQAVHANYRGTLNHDVVTLATRLADAGYHTYMAGKWHLGKDPDSLPSRRGFERTVAMADTGADNWEMKPYLPIYAKANWFADGEELDRLPPDFYSSEFFVDKTIEFIESNRRDGRPFFSYLPFQAVHIPVQAPQQHTDKYLGTYDDGWTRLRERRLERARALGIVPATAALAPVSTTANWDALSEAQKRYESKKMAVYAGMIDAMDHHIGRLVDYLVRTGLYDDTWFVFASDNGAEASDPTFGPGGWLFRLWLRTHGYSTDYETLGTRGSFMNIGPSFASAAASPLAYYKFFAHDGGMRVPLIISGPGIAAGGRISDAFAYVTDIAPTLLDFAGVPAAAGEYAGRRVETISGTSLRALVTGGVERVHAPEQAIGYELGGNAALFEGDHKIVRDRGPVGDGEWHLFDIARDPGETHDLKLEMPSRFAAMLDAYRKYEVENGVLPVPDAYDQRQQVTLNAIRSRLGPYLGWLVAAAAAVLGALGLAIARRRRHRAA